MEKLNIFIILLLFSICYSVIPNWNLTKSSKDLLSSSDHYEYVIYHKNQYQIDLKMIKKITKSEGNITSSNYIIINNDKPKKVPFDNIESFYNLFGGIIICPIGTYHPFNLTNGTYLPPPSRFFNNEGTWDLKCVYLNDSNFFILSYAEREYYHFFYTNGQNIVWDDLKLEKGFYDYKIRDKKIEGTKSQYHMINFVKTSEKKLGFSSTYLDLNLKDEYRYQYGKLNYVNEYLLTTKGFFKNDSTMFYFITYNDPQNFISGYTNSTVDDDYDITYIGFNLNFTSPFGFEEDLEIEEINFILRNKFIYYKLKGQLNNNTYHGIVDLELNQIIFNTNETIISFIPYSDKAMLAITPDTAYRICAYNDGDNCTDDCPGGYVIDTSGNRCLNSTFCPYDELLLMPEEECVKNCNTTINIIIERQCGPCGYFYPNNSYKFVNGTKCLDTIPNWAEIYNNESKLLICHVL